MQAPYITMDNESISAQVTNNAVQKKACIYQHTQDHCSFYIGGNGLQQLEFDYEITGDTWSNWFSFWINSADENGHWVKDCEIDSIENMWKSFAHNFAGQGHQVEIPDGRKMKGHATTWLQSTGAQITNCDYGSEHCDFGGDYAHHTFQDSTANKIQDNKIVHHLTIDYWESWLASSLKVSKIKMKAGGDFTKMCPTAKPM